MFPHCHYDLNLWSLFTNSHTPPKLTGVKREMEDTIYLCCILQSYLSQIKSIGSLELEAILPHPSCQPGEIQAPAMLLPKHSNYNKHGRHGADSYTQMENECEWNAVIIYRSGMQPNCYQPTAT